MNKQPKIYATYPTRSGLAPVEVVRWDGEYVAVHGTQGDGIMGPSSRSLARAKQSAEDWARDIAAKAART